MELPPRQNPRILPRPTIPRQTLEVADLLPFTEAQALRETLIQYAVDTQDHTVSDRFVELLRPRRPH